MVAAVLAVVCSLASPVAGLFLALAAVAYEIVCAHARRRAARGAGGRRAGAALGGVPRRRLPAVHVQVVRRRADLLRSCSSSLLPREHRALRVGAVLYALAATAAYLIDTPMGNNAVRLAELFGGAIVVCFLPWRRELRLRRGLVVAPARRAGAVAALPDGPRRHQNVNDESTQASYYEPLLDFLEREGREPGRIEIPFTRAHFEAYEVARQWPIARGWQRQLDIERNKLFYGGVLNNLTYATWLSENGVRYVALPDAPLDSSSRKERGADRDASRPTCEPRWASEHWRVYEVLLPTRS